MASVVPVQIPIQQTGSQIPGELQYPAGAKGLILFAHGSGSSRRSPRNRWIADHLQNKNYATLRMDLLTEIEAQNRDNIFDCELLANRLMDVALWIRGQPYLERLPLGLFGASTGAGAAVIAAAEWPHQFKALIARGGRPDLARKYLSRLRLPTLLIVGGLDDLVLRLNRSAFEELRCKKKLVVIPGATHLFEEPGKLEVVAEQVIDWLEKNLKPVELPFQNRERAGIVLAQRIKGRKFRDPIVLAIPRGGVAVAVVVARELGAELDVMLSRKIRHPFSPELAIGALAEGSLQVLTEIGKAFQDSDPKRFKEEVKRQTQEIEKRQKRFRSRPSPVSLKGRSVVLVDDGIATGSTFLAALQSIKKQEPYETVVAVPVAPHDSVREIEKWSDEVICLAEPEPFFAVGEFYKDFRPVEDDTVVKLLRDYADERSAKLEQKESTK